MKDIVQIEGLGKRYLIGGLHPGYSTFRELVGNALVSPFRRKDSNDGSSKRKAFWALNNVNLQVQAGEILGIIGPNGAGKSTLLKILSRITKPTTGRVVLHGRVGSLLEVGTGFHPDLTGRENVFLNGAVLGMRRNEIEHKFAEIVAFSEIEEFLDTPVKLYSTGMYLRLAFSVAAHLEPEILIMDEVLAVGDVAFQQKCLSKMQEIRERGQTILFVSHNMPAVLELCERVVLMVQGSIVQDGAPAEIIERYLNGFGKIEPTPTLSAKQDQL